jgi:hypothetical protein
MVRLIRQRVQLHDRIDARFSKGFNPYYSCFLCWLQGGQNLQLLGVVRLKGQRV